MKIYMDVGRNEHQGLPPEIKEYFVKDLVKGINNFRNQLINFGFGESELKLVIDETGNHSVSEAAKRFPGAFLWLFEK
jgi:hypothetical protein